MNQNEKYIEKLHKIAQKEAEQLERIYNSLKKERRKNIFNQVRRELIIRKAIKKGLITKSDSRVIFDSADPAETFYRIAKMKLKSKF